TGNPATARVENGIGVNGSKALAITSPTSFRTDNYAVVNRFNLGGEEEFWVQFKIKPPQNWQEAMYFDVGDTLVAAGIDAVRGPRAWASYDQWFTRIYREMPIPS